MKRPASRLVPLGIFRPTEGLLDRALGQILAAGARVLATGLLAGALVTLWSKLDLHEFKIDTPIVDQVYALLYEGKAPTQAMQELLGRDQKAERI